ncbi:PH domain-containing protein [Gracilibacillus oryzae]|uniref:PH domain-containing protein n=1 Tax=Gracilibacillus oryzae TaxID=1672701 RepID=A0A7C8GQ46_9BACI|nr:PH domain-containing protein [Gracilibacillus oryzae]KAB8125669.1 PH domain-containing protein [Gracilibacillus oryzae]
MIFRSKVDAFFIRFMTIILLILGAASFFPIFLEEGMALPEILTLIAVFLIVTSFLLWCVFSVKYAFYQDYLLVKGGPIRSRIRYEKITKAAPTNAVFAGYRILSARDGLEIFYKNAIFGSVKISPKEKEAFIDELKKRCPDARIEG